jgi:hypothetical protein
MFPLAKMVHVLAVGLWFGAGIFFTFVVGVSLFDTFEKMTTLPDQDRPYWLHEPPELDKAPPSASFPQPLSKEQGSRIAGAAVGPMFASYFILQVTCGVLALLTALVWAGRGGVHRWRAVILLLALLGAGAGWCLEHKVEALRVRRSEASDAVLAGKGPPSSEQLRAADEARAQFGTWHTYSLFTNFGTLALVTAAMALAAFLPARSGEGPR